MSLQLTNGEGYKKTQGDKFYRISINTTYGERRLDKNDGFNVGIVYSNEKTASDPINMISAFGGFSGLGLRLGAEYNILTKENNHEENIISISVNYGIIDNIDAFVRYDMYNDNDLDNKNGGNYLITGVLFNCNNGLSVAPNIRMTSYEDNSNDALNEYKINIQFKF